jgi:hypothetical protein
LHNLIFCGIIYSRAADVFRQAVRMPGWFDWAHSVNDGADEECEDLSIPFLEDIPTDACHVVGGAKPQTHMRDGSPPARAARGVA